MTEQKRAQADAGADEAAIVARIRAAGVVAILRAASAERAQTVGSALIDAGLDVIEVSFNTPDAAAVIERLAADRPGALLGAGTVLHAAEAEGAVRAGARFLLSPVFAPEVDRAARALGCLYIPGVFTAGEAWTALSAGRRLIKLFPAGVLGVAGMRALLEPFGSVDALPTGGIGIADAGAWRAAGAVAVGLGGAITRAPDPVEAAREALARVRSATPPA